MTASIRLTKSNPQVLEAGNEHLIADLYNSLTDAYVGLAGLADHDAGDGADAKTRDDCIGNALSYVERARQGMSHTLTRPISAPTSSPSSTPSPPSTPATPLLAAQHKFHTTNTKKTA